MLKDNAFLSIKHNLPSILMVKNLPEIPTGIRKLISLVLKISDRTDPEGTECLI
jgi:hypothetical protein